MSHSLLLKPDETRGARPLEIFGDRLLIKLAGSDTGGNYAVIESLSPAGGGPPLHRHGREDESFYILEGEFVFEVDGEQMRAGPGCSVFAPKGTAHAFQVVGDGPGRALVIVQPAGLDAFFTEVDSAARGILEPDLSVIVPIFGKYGLELLGPPLGVRKQVASAARKS